MQSSKEFEFPRNCFQPIGPRSRPFLLQAFRFRFGRTTQGRRRGAGADWRLHTLWGRKRVVEDQLRSSW